MARSQDWSKRFPGIRNRVYLANCSQGPLSTDVQKALDEYMRGWLERGNPWGDWMEVVGDASAIFARLIRAKKEEVAPTYSVSAALSTILSGLEFSKRNKIVVTDLDFPATTAAYVAQARRGCKVETILSKDGRVTVEDYEKAIDEKTLLVNVVEVSSLNGFRQDARAIAEIAHAKGAMVFVDSYQTAGNTAIDVKKMGADFLAAGTQKYMLGIPGSAYLYVLNELIESLEPTFTGWFSQNDPFEFGRTKSDFLKDANRFQIGTWSVSSHYAARAGMKILLEVEDRNIQQHISKLTAYLLDRLAEENLTPLNAFADNERGALVSVRIPKPHTMENELRKRRVITSSRGEGLRLAFHFFNTKEDVDAALEALTDLLKRRTIPAIARAGS